MNKPALFQLTIKDASILEGILQRHASRDGPFVRLLRRKLSTATIVLQDAVDPQTATINSRIQVGVDGGPAENRLLVYGGEDAYPGIALPITTLRGLALLGLTAPSSTVCERPDGSIEELRLDRVFHQPEAARRMRSSIAPAGPRSAASIVTLEAHRRDRRGYSLASPDPDGEDPGPQAA